MAKIAYLRQADEGNGELEAVTFTGEGCAISKASASIMTSAVKGMSAEEIKFVGEAYCAADIGHAEGFGGDMNFQHSHRMMRGDGKCRYVFSNEALKPCAAALNKRDIIDEDN